MTEYLVSVVSNNVVITSVKVTSRYALKKQKAYFASMFPDYKIAIEKCIAEE